MAEKPTYEELERRIQELEKAESERSLAEDRLKKIFDNTQDAILVHDLEGKILDVNDKMSRMYGLTKVEALEVTIENISSSGMSMEVLLERWQKVLNGEKLLFEWEARRPKDDSVFSVEVSLQKISFHGKDIVLANVRDITERKQAEEKASESKQTLITILERLPADVYVSDLQDHTVLYMNKSMRQSFGRDCTGEMCYEVFNNASSPCIHCKKPSLLDDQHRPTGIISWDYYNPVVKKWYQNEDQAIPWDGEKFVHIQLATDITERKRAEEALLESEERFRYLAEGSPFGLSLMRPDRTFEFINQQFTNIFGYTLEDIPDKDAWFIKAYPDQEYREKVISTWTKDFGKNGVTGEIQPRVFMVRCNNGQDKVIHFRSALLKNGYWIQTHEDITERKRAEEKIRHRLIYEQMLTSISTMAVEQEDLNRFLNDSLKIMGETLDVSRAYLFEHRHETDSMDNTAEWCAPDESPQKENLQGVPATVIPWWTATLKEGGNICFSDIEDIPDELTKNILRPQGICSILVVPLFVAGRYHGFVGFDECRFPREWPEEDVEILLTISRIIAAAVYKMQSEEEIERERQQLLSIFNSIEESIYISDPETYEILYVNPKLASILQKDCVGGLCYKQFQGFDEPCAFCTNDIILKQQPQPHYWEYYNQKIEKHFFIVDRIIKWPDDRKVRFEMATDIT